MQQTTGSQEHVLDQESLKLKIQAATEKKQAADQHLQMLCSQLNQAKFRAAEHFLNSAIKEYEKIGFNLKVSKDKEGNISNIKVVKTGSGKRGRSASNKFITEEEFENIFKLLENKFSAKDIDKIINHTYPGKELRTGYLRILIENEKWGKLFSKHGKQGKGVYYTKI